MCSVLSMTAVRNSDMLAAEQLDSLPGLKLCWGAQLCLGAGHGVSGACCQ